MGVPSDANLNTMGKLNRIEEIIITQIQIMKTLHNEFHTEEIIITTTDYENNTQ